MESTKLVNGNRHLSSVRPVPESAEKNQKDAARSNGETALRRKTDSANTKPGRQPVRKKTGRKPKAEKLVCRYCAKL